MDDIDAGYVGTRIIEEAWNRGNVDVLDRYVAADYHRRGSAVIDGREAWKQWILAVREAFPDFHVQIHQVIRIDDWAATRFTASATHTTRYLGFEPTGVRFSADGVVIVRLEDGMVAEEWEVIDHG